jgi:hypothetical protein
MLAEHGSLELLGYWFCLLHHWYCFWKTSSICFTVFSCVLVSNDKSCRDANCYTCFFVYSLSLLTCN